MASASAGAWIAASQIGLSVSIASNTFARNDFAPPLSPGAPMSPERLAVIEAFKKNSDGLEKKFEARSYKSD